MFTSTCQADERVEVPGLGVTVHVLDVQGPTVHLGVEAALPSPARAGTHALCNRLGKVSLALHLARRQLTVGQAEAAAQSLERAIADLGTLDRDWIVAQFGAATPA